MAERKKISQLTTAEQLSADDLLPMAIPNQQSSSGFVTRKATSNAIATFFLKVIQFASDLHTTATTIIGAINEIKATADDATDDATEAVSYVTDLADDVTALQLDSAYQDGDIVSLTDLITYGFIDDGNYKFFIPLQKPILTGLVPTITGTFNFHGAVTKNIVTLASVGTVQTFNEELGITVVITSSDTEEGLVLLESINGQITFEEEES